MNFNQRSSEKEYLDRDDIPFEAIRQNMRELEWINAHLGGHRITVAGLKQLMGDTMQCTVCEIGCGGGDNLWAIGSYCTQKNISMHGTGIDINSGCIVFAKEQFEKRQHFIPSIKTEFVVADYRMAEFNGDKPDIIFAALFCHHFTDDALVDMMRWMQRNAMLGFFINDLHRHPVAYHFIKAATRIFSKSWLVKNDAPLSVLRGFKRKEWESILNRAGIAHYQIQWKWAFRYLIVVPNLSTQTPIANAGA